MSIIDFLLEREYEVNYFGEKLKYAPNIVYLVVYVVVFVYYAGMIIVSRYHFFNTTFFIGYGMEFIGFLGRVLAVGNETNLGNYAMQNFCLTVAPAFIMGGVYFMFGQLVVVHGSEFSILPPIWYSYFFITFDVCTILIQAAGGGISSSNSKNSAGTTLMIVGVAAQVGSMTIFLFFWFEFLYRVFFRYAREGPMAKRSIGNFLKMLFNVPSARVYKRNYLDQSYDSSYYYIRQSTLFGYFPLAITIAVIVVYIRCIYRVVELSQGWNGYLMVHEVYLLILDACMMAIAGLVFVPFHPYWVFGKENVLKRSAIKKVKKSKHIRQDQFELADNKPLTAPSVISE